MDTSERFARNLVHEREKAAISPAELAKRAGLPLADVETAESGSTQPPIDALVKLAGSLAISIDTILDGISWKPPGATPGRFTVLDLD
jgi:transcriptional regulator with XRE-family HTH domain